MPQKAARLSPRPIGTASRALSHRKKLQMNYNPQIHQRRSVRLPGFDYTHPVAYFVTVCAYRRECLFGKVAGGNVVLNHLGRLAHEEWAYTKIIRPEVQLDEFVIMPNHIHGIITMQRSSRSVGAHGRAPLLPSGNALLFRQARSLGSLIAGFKSAATKRINQSRHTPGQPVWQRNYYEHVIRGETDLNRIRQYIRDNPAKSTEDIYNPARISRGEP